MAHGAAIGMSEREICTALALPVSVCKCLESPPETCGDSELRQSPAPAPDVNQLAEKILRWCLTQLQIFFTPRCLGN